MSLGDQGFVPGRHCQQQNEGHDLEAERLALLGFLVV
jgi:hypothetical protein